MKRLTTLIAAAALTVAGVAAQSEAAGLLIADGGLGGVLEIQQHAVDVKVNNGIVVTTVNQVFKNTENRQVEALYTFPVPRGASVSNFSMWINGKEMTGEVVEKKRAREIYDSYKAVRRDPGLLEQVDYRTFEMRIFPIAAQAEQRVQLTYYQELDYDHNRATYVYPLATQTRADINARTTGKFGLTFDVKSEVPITSLESTSHPQDFSIAPVSKNYQQASLETDGGDLSRDLVLSFETERPRTGVDLIASRAKGEDGYFSLTLTAGDELAAMNKPMDYVFVLDVSGSMNEDQKLVLSTQSLEAFIGALAPEDRFEVITFNNQPTMLFSNLAPADDGSKKRASEFLGSQAARGGTMLKPALTTAYKYADPTRPLNVILLSDGMSDQKERAQLLSLIKQRPKDCRVFSIGIGNDVNRSLLESLAADSGGLAAFLSRDDNTQRQAQAFRRKLLRPAATDLVIKVDGVDAYDLTPSPLPNLYHGMPVRLYGRYKGSGGGRVTVTGTVAGQPLKQEVNLDFPKDDDDNPEIERVWAMKKIDALLKKGDAEGSRAPVADEIIRLGEAYSVVTEFTSFLVLENDAEYQRWKIERRNALRTGRDRAAQARVTQAMDKLRDAATADLGPAGVERQESASIAKAMAPTPTAATPAAPAAVRQSPPSPATDRPSRNRDFSLPSVGGGGGGAIDPFTVCLVFVLIGGLIIARRSGSAH